MKKFNEIFSEVLDEGVKVAGNTYGWGISFPSVEKLERFVKLALTASDAKSITMFNPSTREIDKDKSKNTAVAFFTNNATAKQLIKQAIEDFDAKKLTK